MGPAHLRRRCPGPRPRPRRSARALRQLLPPLPPGFSAVQRGLAVDNRSLPRLTSSGPSASSEFRLRGARTLLLRRPDRGRSSRIEAGSGCRRRSSATPRRPPAAAARPDGLTRRAPARLGRGCTGTSPGKRQEELRSSAATSPTATAGAASRRPDPSAERGGDQLVRHREDVLAHRPLGHVRVAAVASTRTPCSAAPPSALARSRPMAVRRRRGAARTSAARRRPPLARADGRGTRCGARSNGRDVTPRALQPSAAASSSPSKVEDGVRRQMNSLEHSPRPRRSTISCGPSAVTTAPAVRPDRQQALRCRLASWHPALRADGAAATSWAPAREPALPDPVRPR